MPLWAGTPSVFSNCDSLCLHLNEIELNGHNAIEGFSRQLRTKSVFPTDDSLLKMLYLAMMDITKKWTGRLQDWSLIHAQVAIYFAERMPE